MADTSRYGVVSHNFLFLSVSVFSAFQELGIVLHFCFLPAFSSNVGGEEEEEEA
jgi:hypothetical protein